MWRNDAMTGETCRGEGTGIGRGGTERRAGDKGALLLRLRLRLLRGERLDDMVHALGLEHDLRSVAPRLARELGAELVDVHVLSPQTEASATSAAMRAPTGIWI